MSTYFVRADDDGDSLEVEGPESPHDLPCVRVSSAEGWLAAGFYHADAPELALAILEAAGWTEGTHGDEGITPLQGAVNLLTNHVREAKLKAAYEAELAAEQAWVDAVALRLCNAARRVTGGPDPLASMDDFAPVEVEEWRAVAREALTLEGATK